MTKTIKVLLVDDHSLVRAGLKALLDSCSDIVVVGEASSGEQASKIYLDINPDVVVMDINMPGMGGLKSIQHIVAKDKKAKILVLSAYNDSIHPKHAISNGALGYLTKMSAAERVVEAIKVVSDSKVYIDPILSERIALESIEGSFNPIDVLSKREFEVFKSIVNGVTVNQIAEAFFISPLTAGSHYTNLKKKLNVNSSAELVKIASHLGLVDE